VLIHRSDRIIWDVRIRRSDAERLGWCPLQEPANVAALEPQAGVEPETWLKNEVRRLEKAGNIPARITPFSVQLHERMKIDAKTNSNLTVWAPRTIEHRLHKHGLWPIRRRGPK
jgi:hypothetical protein